MAAAKPRLTSDGFGWLEARRPAGRSSPSLAAASAALQACGAAAVRLTPPPSATPR